MSGNTSLHEDYLAETRAAVLAAALPHAPFSGWSEAGLQAAVKDAGADPNLALLAFPDGVKSLLEVFWASIDAAMMREFPARTLDNAPLSRRIALILRTYIELLRPHREAARRAIALHALPFNATLGLTCLYRTADAMWRAAGDSSTDFNFYTKRASLAAITASAVAFWLAGNEEEALDGFIDRRIEDILRFEKFKARAGNVLRGLPQPAAILGRLAGIVSESLPR